MWEDCKTHDGHPVFSATFFTAPHQPYHIVLITAVSVFISFSRSGVYLNYCFAVSGQ